MGDRIGRVPSSILEKLVGGSNPKRRDSLRTESDFLVLDPAQVNTLDAELFNLNVNDEV